MNNDERKRILQLVADGVISTEEALDLLEASSKSNTSDSTSNVVPLTKQQDEKKEDVFEKVTNQEQSSNTSGFEDIFGKSFSNKETNKKLDEFMNDLRGDLSQFSSRMMSLFNTTFTKVKEFDIEFPFGEKLEFNRNFAYNAQEVKGFDISLPNGKVNVTKTTEPTVILNVQVKTNKGNGEENIADRFSEQFVRLIEGKLIIATDFKFAYITVDLQLPEKQYDIFFAKMLSGSIELTDQSFKVLKLKTYNGAIRAQNIQFDHADLNTGNGSIEARNLNGADLEAETINGRIYVDGKLEEVEAQSVNGHVVVTTSSEKPHKLKANTTAGTVEIYVPKNVSLDGKVSSNFGKTDVTLSDVKIANEEEQFLLKTVYFNKFVEGAPLLKIAAESRTGTVLVRYTTTL